MYNFGSIVTAMVTPFTDAGELDLNAAARLMRYLADNGSDGLVVAGTTGESPTLNDEEKLTLFKLAVDEVGDRCSIIAGTGSNDTAHSVELTTSAAELGVDGHLVVTPYYNKPPRQGLIEHFKAVAAATDKPVMLYNIPGRCVINLEPDLLAELGEVENIVAVKQANSDLSQAEKIVSDTELDLYAGDDNMLCKFLELGGKGGVCVSSHLVGRQMHEMADAVVAGELERAHEIDSRLKDVYDTIFITSGTITTKAALSMIGINVGGVRLPLVEANDHERAEIKAMLEKLDLKVEV